MSYKHGSDLKLLQSHETLELELYACR